MAVKRERRDATDFMQEGHPFDSWPPVPRRSDEPRTLCVRQNFHWTFLFHTAGSLSKLVLVSTHARAIPGRRDVNRIATAIHRIEPVFVAPHRNRGDPAGSLGRPTVASPANSTPNDSTPNEQPIG